MRRSRIKVMATVPARRKPTRDLKNASTDTLQATPIEIPTEIELADLSTPSCPKNSKQSVIEIPKLGTAKEEVALMLEEPLTDPQTVETPVTEPNPMEDPAKRLEPADTTTSEKSNPQKQVVASDNSQASGSKDTKAASGNNDASSVPKTSQTRTSFMRPIPRLDGGGRMRRNSVQGSGASASESEDDSRRGTTGISNRVRNDSVSSVHSPKSRSQNYNTSGYTNASETTIDGDLVISNVLQATKNSFTSNMRRKRKMVVSESARKLAEARREFLLKHEHKQPDKSKLTMYDLIYYNPVTNPMKKSDGSVVSSTQKMSSSVITAETEDDEDEADEPPEAMPVPQVKVGPDGSLVIDEQSLVIEHTGAKKSRQAMARTEALVDEEGNGSGFYKKRQKTKDWSKWETLKFYKALNTVGTDFLLIQSLFPKRTRQEIKLKFKKEEKLNPRLVEKALTYHQEFDIDSLKEDLATFDETIRKRSEVAKTENQPSAQQRGRRKKIRRMVASSIPELNESVEECNSSQELAACDDEEILEATSSGEQKKSGPRRTVPSDSPSRLESANSSNESGSDTEIYQVKPTRSGRMPKVRKLQAPTINTLDNTFSDDEEDAEQCTSPSSSVSNNVQNNVLPNNSKVNGKPMIVEAICDEDRDASWKSQCLQNSLSGISQVEPGSLVIVSRESADDPGETVLQVYMVSSDIDDGHGKRNMTPVVLTPELLNTVTAGITKVAPIDVKRE